MVTLHIWRHLLIAFNVGPFCDASVGQERQEFSLWVAAWLVDVALTELTALDVKFKLFHLRTLFLLDMEVFRSGSWISELWRLSAVDILLLDSYWLAFCLHWNYFMWLKHVKTLCPIHVFKRWLGHIHEHIFIDMQLMQSVFPPRARCRLRWPFVLQTLEEHVLLETGLVLCSQTGLFYLLVCFDIFLWFTAHSVIVY